MPTTPSPQRNSSSDRADSHPPSELPRSATATPPSSRSSPMHERWRTYGDGNRNIDTSGDGLFVSVEDNWDDGIELDLDPARVSPEPSESSLQSAVGAIRKRKVDDRHQARRQSDLALDSEVQQASCHQGRQRISQAGMFGQINALNTAYVPDCAQNRREAAQADSTLIRKKSRLPSRHEAPARPTRPNTGAYPMPQTVYSRADDTRFLNHGREQWDHTRPDVVPRRLPAQAAESTPVSLDTHTIRRPQGPVGRRQEDLFVPTPTAATTGPMGWTSIQPAPMRR